MFLKLSANFFLNFLKWFWFIVTFIVCFFEFLDFFLLFRNTVFLSFIYFFIIFSFLKLLLNLLQTFFTSLRNYLIKYPRKHLQLFSFFPFSPLFVCYVTFFQEIMREIHCSKDDWSSISKTPQFYKIPPRL